MSARGKAFGLVAVASAALLLSSCDNATTPEASATTGIACNVGIAMPTRSLERWINDGEGLQALLQADQCTVDLQYADNKSDQQISQLQNMITNGAKILVIAAVDSATLGPVLQEAADAGVVIIAYDRLLMDTTNEDYYATFDAISVGTLQGQFIETALNLKDPTSGPFNFEPFAGSPDDNNAKLFFQGAWDVLSPYITSGQLVVRSGKAPATLDEWVNIGILKWDTATAQAEMENRLSSFYTTEKVDAVLSPNDSLAQGIAAALLGNGYVAGPDYPILTGQDGDKASVKNILAGTQTMTVWKDTRELGKLTHKMIQAIVAGTPVETNTTYNNNVMDVPTNQIAPSVVTKDTVQSSLIDSGFLKASDVGL